MEVINSLSQLSDLITYSSDEALLLSAFSAGGATQHLTELVQLLASPDPSIQLMSVKILTQILDQVPHSIAMAVQAGAAEALTEKLLSIEYMDVAEQSISALAHISVHHPQVCM